MGPSLPAIVAHRGDSANFPENTRPAFDACLKLPIAGIELDLQMTRDGHVICYHDRSFTKAGHRGWRPCLMPYERIADLDIGSWFNRKYSHCRLLKLDELLMRYAQETQLLLEIKLRGGLDHSRELALKVAQRVAEGSLMNRAVFLCFDVDILALIHAHHPNARCVLNTNQDLTHTIGTPGFAFLHGYSARLNAVSKPFSQAVHDCGKTMMAFTCDNPRALAKLQSAGVDVIMTNRPQWLLSLVSAAG